MVALGYLSHRKYVTGFILTRVNKALPNKKENAGQRVANVARAWCRRNEGSHCQKHCQNENSDLLQMSEVPDSIGGRTRTSNLGPAD